jgi:uncharacterized membrane protein
MSDSADLRSSMARSGLARSGTAGAGIALAFVLAFALAIGLRLQQASAPVTFDEFASLYFSRQSFGDLWGWWMVRETNPPLFYSALKAWRMVVPEEQVALRMLPLAIGLAQIALLARFAARTFGWRAGLACVVLLAISPTDIFASESLRAYGLAKLMVTVSLLGLVRALGADGCPPARRGWAGYVAGAVLADFSHTTMLLWPGIAGLAAVAQAWWSREGLVWRRLRQMVLAGIAILALSGWVIALAFEQMQTRSANIGWIQSLPLDDFVASANLQIMVDGVLTWHVFALMIGVGLWRTWHAPVTRLALLSALVTLVTFKAADLIHPVVSDYTLHWAAIFTTIVAAASLSRTSCPPHWGWLEVRIAPGVSRWLRRVGPPVLIVALAAAGWSDLNSEDGWMPHPQDWHETVTTVARHPGSALLVSHESIGVVVQEACALEWHRDYCPFPLVVMASPAQSDSWAFGGYRGPIVSAAGVPAALGNAREVYAFSRYVYRPLAPFGLDAGDYHEQEWDDGELIGPIPVESFTRKAERGAVSGEVG